MKKQTLSDEEIIQRIKDISESIDKKAGLVVLYKGKNKCFCTLQGRKIALAEAVGLNCLNDEDLFEIITKSIITAKIIAISRDN